MIKTNFMIKNNRRLRFTVMVKFILFYSELALLTHDVKCSRLYLDEKYERKMSGQQPLCILISFDVNDYALRSKNSYRIMYF